MTSRPLLRSGFFEVAAVDATWPRMLLRLLLPPPQTCHGCCFLSEVVDAVTVATEHGRRGGQRPVQTVARHPTARGARAVLQPEKTQTGRAAAT